MEVNTTLFDKAIGDFFARTYGYKIIYVDHLDDSLLSNNELKCFFKLSSLVSNIYRTKFYTKENWFKYWHYRLKYNDLKNFKKYHKYYGSIGKTIPKFFDALFYGQMGHIKRASHKAAPDKDIISLTPEELFVQIIDSNSEYCTDIFDSIYTNYYANV